MRVVGADDGKSCTPGLADRGEMAGRVYFELHGTPADVLHRVALFDRRVRSDQQTAALERRVRTRVRDDGIDNGAPHTHYTASTIIAIPMPPPMQRDAAPLPPPRAFSEWTRVVRIRAPLAPMGCPSAMAPPWTLTFAGSSCSSRATAIDCDANASFSS